MDTTMRARRRQRPGPGCLLLRAVSRLAGSRRLAMLALLAGIGAVTLGALGGFIAAGHARGTQPRLFFRPVDGALLDNYAGVAVIAHNAGDSRSATRQALRYGAGIIEVDVISRGGRLYAAHDAPPPYIGAVTFRGPTLEEVWAGAAEAEAIMLDLKEMSPAFLDLLFTFLDERPPAPRVMVVNGSSTTLRAFRERAPQVLRILGVSPPGRFAALQADEDLIDLIDGVVMREHLLDEERAAWLNERGLYTIVYTVNDLARVNALVALGVDAISTDNFAIMELLGRRPDASA